MRGDDIDRGAEPTHSVHQPFDNQQMERAMKIVAIGGSGPIGTTGMAMADGR